MKSYQMFNQLVRSPVFLTGLTFFIYHFIAGPVFFETNDDMAMMHIVNGFIFGTPDPHQVFQHHYLGLLYSSLYELHPETPWYSLLLSLSAAVSIYSIFKVLKENVNPDVWLPLAIFLTIYAAHSIFVMQFTRISILCGSAGLLLFLDNIKKKSALTFLLGISLILLSYMIRSSGLLLAVVLIAPVITLISYQQKQLIKTIFLSSIIIATVNIIKFHGEHIIAKDQAWEEYYEINIIRGYIHDNKLVTPETFKEAGFTKNEHKMFSTWNWFDKSIFNKESLNKLVTLTKNSASANLDIDRGLQILNQKNQRIWYAFTFITLLFFGGPAAFTFTAYAALVLILLASSVRLPLRILEPAITLIFVYILFLSNLNIKYHFQAYFSRAIRSLKQKKIPLKIDHLKTLTLVIVVGIGTYLHFIYISVIIRDKTTSLTNEAFYTNRLHFIKNTSINSTRVYILPGLTQPTRIYHDVSKNIIGNKGIYAGWGVQMPAYYTNLENKTLSASQFIASNENTNPIIIYSICDSPQLTGPAQILQLYMEEKTEKKVNASVHFSQELRYCAYIFHYSDNYNNPTDHNWQLINQ